VYRDLYKTDYETIINTDVNDALNIAKKIGMLGSDNRVENRGVLVTAKRIRGALTLNFSGTPVVQVRGDVRLFLISIL